MTAGPSSGPSPPETGRPYTSAAARSTAFAMMTSRGIARRLAAGSVDRAPPPHCQHSCSQHVTCSRRRLIPRRTSVGNRRRHNTPLAVCPHPSLIWDKEAIRHARTPHSSGCSQRLRTSNLCSSVFLSLAGDSLHSERSHLAADAAVASPRHVTLRTIFIPTLLKRPHIVHPS